MGNCIDKLEGPLLAHKWHAKFANLYAHFIFKEVLIDPALIFRNRFIDDGFFIIKDEASSKRVMQNLNAATSLDIIWDISTYTATDLDLTIYKGDRFHQRGMLDTKV